MQDFDLETIWDLASEENNNQFEPALLAELSIDTKADDDCVAAFLRCVFKDRLFFKYKEGKIHVHSPVKVEQLLVQHQKEEKKRQLIENGAQSLTDLLHNRKPVEEIEKDCRECLDIVGDYYLFGNDAQHADITRQILKSAKLNRAHDPFHIMVKAGIWDKNENIGLPVDEQVYIFSLNRRLSKHRQHVFIV